MYMETIKERFLTRDSPFVGLTIQCLSNLVNELNAINPELEMLTVLHLPPYTRSYYR
jgi:hypothetical protein